MDEIIGLLYKIDVVSLISDEYTKFWMKLRHQVLDEHI